MPEISVVIPVHNAEQYIRGCLDSLINQPYKDIEIICVDDCSTDGSLSILEEYALKDDRIKVLKGLPGSKGKIGSVRNAGFDVSTGKYVFFSDADDTVEPDIFTVLSQKINETNADIYAFDYYVVEKGVKQKAVSGFSKEKILYEKDIIKMSFNKTCWCMLYKTEFLKNNDIRFPDVYLQEDILFNMICQYNAKKVHILKDKFLYNYIIRNKSFSKRINDNAGLAVDALIKLKDYLIRNNKYEKFKKSYECMKEPFLISAGHLLPEEKKPEFIENAKNVFTGKEYKKFLKHIYKKRSFKEYLLSVVNEYDFSKKEKKKVITVLGQRFIINKKLP